jgi:hypothetical protein
MEPVGSGNIDLVSFNYQEGKRLIVPHPVSGESLLKFENPGNEQVKLQIFNSSGSLVKVYKTSSNQILLSKSEFDRGLYLYRLSSGKKYLISAGKFLTY